MESCLSDLRFGHECWIDILSESKPEIRGTHINLAVRQCENHNPHHTKSRAKSQMGFAGCETVHCKTNSFPFVLGVTCTPHTAACSHNAIELCPLTSTSGSCWRAEGEWEGAALILLLTMRVTVGMQTQYAVRQHKG